MPATANVALLIIDNTEGTHHRHVSRDITKIYDTAAGGTVHTLSKINLESAIR